MPAMPPVKSKPVLLSGAAVLLALIVISWNMLERKAQPPDRPSAPGTAAPSNREAPPSAPEKLPDGDSPAAKDERVSGACLVVRCPKAPTATGFVSLTGTAGDMPTERGELHEGVVRIDIPRSWFEGVTNITVDVGVAGTGVRKTVQSTELELGETKEVVISPEVGLEIRGRLLDASDCGIPRIRIVGRFRRRPGAKQASQYDSDVFLYSAHPFVEPRAVTGEDGSFCLGGLQGREYFLTTSDPRWVIVPTERPPMTPPLDGVELRAVRSYQLDLSIRDSQSREPVPNSRARIHMQTNVGSNRFTVHCPAGRNTVVWPPRGRAMDEESGFVFKMQVSAFGYEPRDVEARFAPGERAITRTVDLDPGPMGEIVLDVLRASGDTMSGEVAVAISRGSTEYRFFLTPDAESNTFRQRVPAGSWRVTVYPRRTFGPFDLRWRQTLSVPEDGVAEARVHLTPYGSLAVDRGEHAAVLLEFEMTKGQYASTIISRRNPRIPCIQAGVWPYKAEVEVDGKWQLLKTGTVEIRDNEESLLKFD